MKVTPGGPQPKSSGSGNGFSSTSELGALDKAEVQSNFMGALSRVNRCMNDGRRRIPYLGGDFDLFLRVNATGKAATAYFTRSTLGDEQVESCILSVYRKQRWPRPVGGDHGEITHGMGFDPDPDADQPREWAEGQLRRAMSSDPDAGAGAFSELRKSLDDCRTGASASSMQVTLYIDEDGIGKAAGIGGRDGRARAAAECVSTVVLTTSFPTPGNNRPAKATVDLP
jgi:hypothetical protein